MQTRVDAIALRPRSHLLVLQQPQDLFQAHNVPPVALDETLQLFCPRRCRTLR
jgi:hypothetical protein